MPTNDDDGPLYCEGCDQELDSDGSCPTPSCDTNGAEYYRDTSAGDDASPSAGATRQVALGVLELGDQLEQAPEWLRDAVREALANLPSVTAALCQAALAVRGVAKDRTSDDSQGKYNFRGIDGILNAVHHPLAEAGVLMVPRDLEIEREPWQHWGQGKWTLYRVHLEWEIFGPRGDSIYVTNWGEALDNADKGLGKARSYAQKDLLIRLLTIPTQDPDFGDTEATQYAGDDDDENDTRPARRRAARGDDSGEPTPADPEVVANLQYILAGLDDERRGKLREAWKRSLGPVPPEQLDGRGARRAMALVKGMVPDHEKVLEQTKMKVEIGDLEDPTITSPGEHDGSGDDTSAPPADETEPSSTAAAEPDASASTTVEDDTSEARAEGDASSVDEDQRREQKRAERGARAEQARALQDFIGSIEPAELERHGGEVGELHWATVDKDLRDTYGVEPGDLHIDIRRMALVVGRAVGPEALAELVDDGLLPGIQADPEA